MSSDLGTAGSELFIVDNSDQNWKVLKYLHDWCQLSRAIDIATGYFEIGSLLALDGEWQKVDRIRLLIGDEVSRRTKNAFAEGLDQVKTRLDNSLETEKEKNDFLVGVPAIVEAIRNGKIICRVYRKNKFHAKAYITHARQEVVGSFGLVGSSNFTYPGLSENIELNIQVPGRPVAALQQWYEEHWNDAEDVTPEILQTIERHTRAYSPFEIYAKSLHEFFRGHEQTATEWERNDSLVYPVLAKYQKDGYHALMKKANKYRGAFLCDGVGLGKTFIGLMLIERLVVHDNKRVALFVPKSAREPVWEDTLKRYLPEIFEGFYSFKIFNHTDLLRDRTYERMEQVRKQADVIIIDEAHHFRNIGKRGKSDSDIGSRYWHMFNVAEDKQMFMLTATPVNNRLTDLQHMIELFSHRQTDYFKDAPLGIHSLRGHIQALEKAVELAANQQGQGNNIVDINYLEAEETLAQDQLFQELVVQRSRAYVKMSMASEEDDEILFPKPREPKVAEYSVKQTYGKLLNMVEEAFNKDQPLFSLPVYYPYAYYTGPDESIDPLAEGRQRQVVSLIRISFLKRFESSAEAFTMSCWNLLRKLLAWIEVHAKTMGEKGRVERWKRQNSKLIGYVHEHQLGLFGGETEQDAEEDIIPEEMLEAVEELPRDDFKVEEIIAETLLDMDQLATFLKELQNFKPAQDKKLRGLIRLLKNDSVLKKHKVIIFTEFMDTARYLRNELEKEGLTGIGEVDSATKGDRIDVIRRFSPYYNGTTSEELKEKGQDEIRILISTDVLSEGLNLQDATRLINYDIHWNPVRLMQRIGRIDRRMNPEIEAQIIADHPDQKRLRGDVGYWNFLPPDDLDGLLKLYKKVSQKTLRISKTFGIEGRKLLTPDDEYDDLRDFAEAYEGKVSPVENMRLELQQLLKNYPDLESKLNEFPRRIFSGKDHPTDGSHAIFFCYALPAKESVVRDGLDQEAGIDEWSIENGLIQWYLYDLSSDEIFKDATDIIDLIRSKSETPRNCKIEQKTLSDIRNKIEKYIKNTYLRRVQAPIGVKAVLKAWMELN
jgi:superfamily II DNA or RNA helicase